MLHRTRIATNVLVLLGLGTVAFVGSACGSSSDNSTFDPKNGGLFGSGDVDGGGSDPGAFMSADDVLMAGCAAATSGATRQPVYMLVVLDGSGSMDQDNKWAAIVPALDSFFDDLKSKADPGFAVGLTIFSDQNDTTDGMGPYPKIDVPIAFVDDTQAKTLRKRLDSTGPSGPTPTEAVLSGQYPNLELFTPASPLYSGGKKVLVLMTDGVPKPDTQTQQQQVLQLVGAETAKGITTFGVGIGNLQPLDTDNYDPKFMGALAQAGGAANAGCDPNEVVDPVKMCHFQVTPGGKSAAQLEKDFVDAINAIRGAVASCEYTIDKSGGDSVDPSKVNVIYTDGNGANTLVPENGTDGWTYDDPNKPSKVILHGKACETAKADMNGKVKIVLGCKSVTK